MWGGPQRYTSSHPGPGLNLGVAQFGHNVDDFNENLLFNWSVSAHINYDNKKLPTLDQSKKLLLINLKIS